MTYLKVKYGLQAMESGIFVVVKFEPESHYVAKAGLELDGPPASASHSTGIIDMSEHQGSDIFKIL